MEILTNSSPMKLESVSDEGFSDVNVMDLVNSEDYVSSDLSPNKEPMEDKKQLIGKFRCKENFPQLLMLSCMILVQFLSKKLIVFITVIFHSFKH